MRQQNRKRRHQPTKNDGLKHSEIVRQKGLGGAVTRSSAKVKTKHGYATVSCQNTKFVVKHELMLAGNSTGLGSNDKGDKYIKILSGSLYVQRNGSQFTRCLTGTEIYLPRGETYCVATTGTEDADLLIVETANYDKTWKQIENATTRGASIGDFAQPTQPVQPRSSDQERTRQIQADLSRNRLREKTGKAGKKGGPAFNANSSSIPGAVNLKPTFGNFGEE